MRFLLALVGAFATLASGKEWSYRNITDWLDIGMCNHTGDQSPIDVIESEAVTSPDCQPLSLVGVEGDAEGRLETNQHTWEVHVEGSHIVNWENSQFQLLQFHFHSPSENKVDGSFFDMEAHMVHKNMATGKLLVVAQMFQVGSVNTFLEGFWGNFPKDASEKEMPQTIGNPYNILAEEKPVEHYWSWSGSLTTPPCTNETVWILAKSVNTMSQEQLDDFRTGISEVNGTQVVVDRSFSPAGAGGIWNHSLGDDNRPVQPVNAPGQHTRDVYTCDAGMTTTTTEAPGGFPWWAWFLIAGLVILSVCFCVLLIYMFMLRSEAPKKKRGMKAESRPLMQQPPPASVNVPATTPTAITPQLLTPPVMVQAQPAPSMLYVPGSVPTQQMYAAPQPTFAPAAGSVQMAPLSTQYQQYQQPVPQFQFNP